METWNNSEDITEHHPWQDITRMSTPSFLKLKDMMKMHRLQKIST